LVARVIPVSAILQSGAVGLLAAVVWMIVTGRLVPRRALLDAQAERDRWYEAAMIAGQQNNQLLLGARTTHEVIRALPDAAAGERA
jgi:hypothetical protein